MKNGLLVHLFMVFSLKWWKSRLYTVARSENARKIVEKYNLHLKVILLFLKDIL